jgi:hypothetical protein
VIGVARDGNRDLRGSRRRDHCCGRPVERSAIPAKSDRGLSGSATVRSYSQVPRTTRGRIGRHLPPTAWAGRRCAAQAGPPVGGGNVGHWKWRNTSFPRGFWKSFPNRSAGNGRSPGKPPFPDFQRHFRGHGGKPDRRRREQLHD